MKKLQVNCCIKVILIFGGIILMQLLAYMLCVMGYIAIHFVGGENYADILSNMAQIMTSDSNLLMWVSAVSALLSLIWCGVLYNKSDWRVKGTDYREVFSRGNVVAFVCIGIGGCVLLTMLLTILSLQFPKAFENYSQIMSNFSNGNMVLTMAYALVIGPVSEEMIFRGAIFDRLYLAFPFWVANALQAALFGLYHMNLIQGLYAFCLGMLLGMIVHGTGSILSSMMTHILFNTTSYVLPVVLASKYVAVRYMGIVAMLVTVVGAVVGIRYYIILNKSKASSTNIQM